MLFCRGTGKRLEQMGVMGGSHFDGPSLHRRGDFVGDRPVYLLALADSGLDCFKCCLGKISAHLFQIENILSEILGNRSLVFIKTGGEMVGSLLECHLSECSHKSKYLLSLIILQR